MVGLAEPETRVRELGAPELPQKEYLEPRAHVDAHLLYLDRLAESRRASYRAVGAVRYRTFIEANNPYSRLQL